MQPHKAKIAERVIEIFEFFAQERRPATVTDIVYRCGRPQSSTSELLKVLVTLGMLYRDSETRSYVPTPRLAALGQALQPEAIGSGRLFSYMARLAQTSRCGIGLFGMVGTRVQVLHWESGGEPRGRRIAGGQAVQLSSSAVGLLLLSSLGEEQAGKVLWRLRAEAGTEREGFDLREAKVRTAAFGRTGRAVGASGFAPGTDVAAVMLPGYLDERSLALGAIYPAGSAVDPEAILSTLQRGVQQCTFETCEIEPPFLRDMMTAV